MSKDVAVCRHNEEMEERGKIGWVEARKLFVLRFSFITKCTFKRRGGQSKADTQTELNMA